MLSPGWFVCPNHVLESAEKAEPSETQWHTYDGIPATAWTLYNFRTVFWFLDADITFLTCTLVWLLKHHPQGFSDSIRPLIQMSRIVLKDSMIMLCLYLLLVVLVSAVVVVVVLLLSLIWLLSFWLLVVASQSSTSVVTGSSSHISLRLFTSAHGRQYYYYHYYYYH